MITSRQNPKIQLVTRLTSNRRRKENADSFMVEGVRLVEEVINTAWNIQFMLVTEGITERARNLRKLAESKGILVEEVPPELMREIADTDAPQGVLAVVSYRQLVVPEKPDFCLVADGVRDPGNMGTLLRTAESAGVQAVIVAPGSVDVFSPKVLRAGMGAHFRLPILMLNWAEIQEFFSNRVSTPIHLYRTDVREGKSLWDVDLKEPVAIFIGSEAEGVSSEAMSLVKDALHIPMPGQGESLNASIAAGVILYEVVRQRNHIRQKIR